MIYCRGTWESCRASGMTMLEVWGVAEDGQQFGFSRLIQRATWDKDDGKAAVEQFVMQQIGVFLVRKGYAEDIVWDWYEEPPCRNAILQMQINLDAPKCSPRLRSQSPSRR